jgi:hypothetical protein
MDYATKQVMLLWLEHASKEISENLENFTKNLDKIEDLKTQYINKATALNKKAVDLISDGVSEKDITEQLTQYTNLLSEMDLQVELLIRHALIVSSIRNDSLINTVSYATTRLRDRATYLGGNQSLNESITKLNQKVEGM